MLFLPFRGYLAGSERPPRSQLVEQKMTRSSWTSQSYGGRKQESSRWRFRHRSGDWRFIHQASSVPFAVNSYRLLQFHYMYVEEVRHPTSKLSRSLSCCFWTWPDVLPRVRSTLTFSFRGLDLFFMSGNKACKRMPHGLIVAYRAWYATNVLVCLNLRRCRGIQNWDFEDLGIISLGVWSM